MSPTGWGQRQAQGGVMGGQAPLCPTPPLPCLGASVCSSPLSVPLFRVPSTCAFLPPPLLINILLTSSRPSSNFTHLGQLSAWNHHTASWTTICWCFLNDGINFTSHTGAPCCFSGTQSCCCWITSCAVRSFSCAEWFREDARPGGWTWPDCHILALESQESYLLSTSIFLSVKWRS